MKNTIIYDYPPELFNLLVDAIPLLCRSKSDVLTFFKGCGISNHYTLDLETTVRLSRETISKYEIVRTILTKLNEEGEKTLRERREVLKRVVEFDSYSSCWPNDQLKARGLISEIQKVVNAKDSFTRMKIEREREAQKNRDIYQQKVEETRSLRNERDKIREEFNDLFKINNPQKRGKSSESILNSIFDSYEILVRESFTLKGDENEGIIEQIDGVIELENRVFLVEMKWWDKPIGVAEVSQHLVRIFTRGQAYGIFISTSPFTKAAVATCKEALSKTLIILMNLEELYMILEHEGDLKDYLKRKIQAAIIEKEPLYKPLIK